MRYLVVNTDLLLNGKLISEGSSIELTSEQTEGITSYLQPLEEEEIVTKTKKPVPNPVPNSDLGSIREPIIKKQSNIKKEK